MSAENTNPHAELKHHCDGLRYDLKTCLLNSECVHEYHHTPKACLSDPALAPYVPEKCLVLANTFFECKRSLVDMRRRFRGPKGY